MNYKMNYRKYSNNARSFCVIRKVKGVLLQL